MVLSRGQRGVTFIELVVALSMTSLVVVMALALFKDAGLAARLSGSRGEQDRNARTFFSSLTDNLLSGGGILSLGPERLRLLNVSGRPMEYAWGDNTLKVNGQPWPVQVVSLELETWGPSLPPGEAGSREKMEYAEVDSLDDDHNGLIDFSELDRDRSGELETQEARYIGKVMIRMRLARDGILDSLVAVVHPRNHARETVTSALDDLPGVGDFGR